MVITYIGHSGFLIEWDTCYWLFDYYKGDLPKMDTGKMLFVFASHKHEDHFNPQIFQLYDNHPKITYVLSSDIKLKKQGYSELGTTAEKLDRMKDKMIFVKPSCQYELYDIVDNLITLKTLKSTDCGVAFLLQYSGKTIYHAGDLNLWLWEGESKQYNNNMRAMFQREMDHLNETSIDIGFVPLDPRQENYYYLGLESLLNTAKVNYVFPMHFWEKPEIIQQFKRERTIDKSTTIMDINQSGQQWKL